MKSGFVLGILICLIAVLPFASAYKVALFVDSPSGLKSSCISINRGATAKEVLEASDFDAGYSYGGLFLDSIDGLANNFADSKSWWFYYDIGNGLESSQVGITDFKADKNATIVYFEYSEYDENFQVLSQPQNVSYYDVCRSEANTLVLKGAYIVTEDYHEINSTAVFVESGSEPQIALSLKNEVLGKLADRWDAAIEGVVEFDFNGKKYNADFNVLPDDTERIKLAFEAPSEPGFYKGDLSIKGNDEYEDYSEYKKVYIGIAKETPKETKVVTTIALAEVPRNATETTVVNEMPVETDSDSVPDNSNLPAIGIIALLASLCLLMIIAIAVLMRK